MFPCYRIQGRGLNRRLATLFPGKARFDGQHGRHPRLTTLFLGKAHFDGQHGTHQDGGWGLTSKS